jgi:glycosyltransferase involved in cell wall biosynthesis
MDCDVPPQVTYWTGVWQPGREALSNEVQALRDLHGGRAPVVSFSSGQRSAVSLRDRVVRLSSARWAALRAVAAAVEPRGQVTHVFGALDEWHLLRAVGRRPVVFTVALPGRALDSTLARKVSIFAAETESLAGALIEAGVPRDRVAVVYPGVNLQHFCPDPEVLVPTDGRFRLLFASTPADPKEFDRRGIPFLVELARARPEVDIVLLWRDWGSRRAANRALARLSPPDNIVVETKDGRSMPDIYRSADATVICYEDGFGKSCPNSIVESVACGRPALVASTCGLAPLVARSGAGAVFSRDVDAAAAALDAVRRNYPSMAVRARMLAVDHFDIDRFRLRYCELYARLARAA